MNRPELSTMTRNTVPAKADQLNTVQLYDVGNYSPGDDSLRHTSCRCQWCGNRSITA
jgi:hypothetical protein